MAIVMAVIMAAFVILYAGQHPVIGTKSSPAASTGGGAVYFNGSTYLQFNRSFNGNFSAVAWVEYTRFNGTGVIAAQGVGQNGHSVWYLGSGGEIPGMTLCGVFSDQKVGNFTAGWRFARSGFIGTGMWHQLACVYNGSEVSLYIDGRLANYTSTPYAMSKGSIIQVGKRTSVFYINGSIQSYAYFTGYIQDLQIYGAALTSTQISSLFYGGRNSTLPGYSPYAPLK